MRSFITGLYMRPPLDQMGTLKENIRGSGSFEPLLIIEEVKYE